MEDQLSSCQNSDLNNDLALCIDNNDNQMIFVGHIVYLCPSLHHLHPHSARVQLMLLGPRINYALENSYDYILLYRQSHN